MTTDLYRSLPAGVRRVVDRGIALGATRVLLYGSRARGTGYDRSDWDLAFDGVRDPAGWRNFLWDLREDPPTILPVDAVRLEDAPPALLGNIERDGRLLWTRDASPRTLDGGSEVRPDPLLAGELPRRSDS